MTHSADLRLTDNGDVAAVSITTLKGDGELAERAEAALGALDGVTVE